MLPNTYKDNILLLELPKFTKNSVIVKSKKSPVSKQSIAPEILKPEDLKAPKRDSYGGRGASILSGWKRSPKASEHKTFAIRYSSWLYYITNQAL